MIVPKYVEIPQILQVLRCEQKVEVNERVVEVPKLEYQETIVTRDVDQIVMVPRYTVPSRSDEQHEQVTTVEIQRCDEVRMELESGCKDKIEVTEENAIQEASEQQLPSTPQEKLPGRNSKVAAAAVAAVTFPVGVATSFVRLLKNRGGAKPEAEDAGHGRPRSGRPA